MEHHIKFIRYLVDKGGPEKNDYSELDSWLIEVSEQVKDGRLQKGQLAQIQAEFGDAFSAETMQGFAYQKPHGYSGDFEMLDRIYLNYTSNQPHLSKWDIYWQKHSAAEAVRNRLEYFYQLLNKLRIDNSDNNKKFHVLNLASGSGRDLLYFFDRHPEFNVVIDCVEQDKNAIKYASELCINYLHKIKFIQKNVLRFKQDNKYDLIWSAGLFDYFDDRIFITMLKKLKGMVKDKGEIVIGNFSTENSSKPFMDIFEWHLNHRSPELLKELALSAGFDKKQISIEKEALGINLFLHLKLDI